jgi:hypothetical protein
MCMTLNTKKGISFLTGIDLVTKKTSKVSVNDHMC